MFRLQTKADLRKTILKANQATLCRAESWTLALFFDNVQHSDVLGAGFVAATATYGVHV